MAYFWHGIFQDWSKDVIRGSPQIIPLYLLAIALRQYIYTMDQGRDKLFQFSKLKLICIKIANGSRAKVRLGGIPAILRLKGGSITP